MTVDVARRRTRKTTKVDTSDAPSAAADLRVDLDRRDRADRLLLPQLPAAAGDGRPQVPGLQDPPRRRRPARKASGFVALGLAIGLAIGGVPPAWRCPARTTARRATPRSPPGSRPPSPPPSCPPGPRSRPRPRSPSARPLATTAPVGGPVGDPAARQAPRSSRRPTSTPSSPPRCRSSSRRSPSKTFDTYTVFQVLRSVSADAVNGRPARRRHIADWSGGAELADGPHRLLRRCPGRPRPTASTRRSGTRRPTSRPRRTCSSCSAGCRRSTASSHGVAAGAGVTIPQPGDALT